MGGALVATASAPPAGAQAPNPNRCAIDLDAQGPAATEVVWSATHNVQARFDCYFTDPSGAGILAGFSFNPRDTTNTARPLLLGDLDSSSCGTLEFSHLCWDTAVSTHVGAYWHWVGSVNLAAKALGTHAAYEPISGANHFACAQNLTPGVNFHTNTSGDGGAGQVQIEVYSCTHLAEAPEAPGPPPIEELEPGLGTCEITAASITDLETDTVVTSLADPDQPTYETDRDYLVSVTTVNASHISVRLADETPTEPEHEYQTFSPTSPWEVQVTFRREGEWLPIVQCWGPDGNSIQFVFGKGLLGAPGAGDFTGRLANCLGESFDDVGGFDLFDPGSWDDAIGDALNPINYVKSSMCVGQVLFIPRAADFAYVRAQLTSMYGGSGVQTVVDGVAAPLHAVSAFADNAAGGTCEGPDIQIPVDGGTVDTHLLDACSDGVGQVRDVVFTGEQVAVYVGGSMIALRMLASAFGIGSVTAATGRKDDDE